MTTTQKRERFDWKRPDARKIADDIVHGAFITEGTMVAFPTCFPAVTVPLPADESRICAMDVSHQGMVYAGTSGRASHLLVGMFHGVTGMVFDMGTVDGATSCPAIVCGKDKFIAAANGPSGGKLITHKLQPLPFDLIQEWHVGRTPFEFIGPELTGEAITHLVADATLSHAIGTTPTRLFRIEFATGKLTVIANLPGRGHLACSGSTVLGADEGSSLWRYDVEHDKLHRRAIALPSSGRWSPDALRWARDTVTGRLYTADTAGAIHALEGDRFTHELARVPVAPVGPMAVTLDGRLYGTFGEGMSMLFCFNPDTANLKRLGVAVSVLERRRYGYSFGSAAVGRDGQIFFGEDDDLGHLWMYFPSIQRKETR